jgi:signal transduction histidine kinase
VVTLADSPSRVAIRISDQGGGIPHEDMEKVAQPSNSTTTTLPSQPLLLFLSLSLFSTPQIWNFSFSTSPKPQFDAFFTPQMGATLEQQSVQWPIAGTGYGLPISRVFAEFLGGSLDIQSLHGHGTDAYVMMKKNVEDQLDKAI